MISINGIEDHIHILIDFINEPPKVLLREMKASTTKWIKAEHREEFPHFNGFGKEYFCCSVSPRNIQAVIEYIRAQRRHHAGPQAESFEVEMRKIMRQAGFDSKKMEFYFKE